MMQPKVSILSASPLCLIAPDLHFGTYLSISQWTNIKVKFRKDLYTKGIAVICLSILTICLGLFM